MTHPDQRPDVYARLLKRKEMKTLSHEEEMRLFDLLAAGDQSARDRLIRANLKFAAQVARNYEGKGLDFDDLFAEAVIGLCKSVDRFNPNTGYKFITYAVWWIRHHILSALADMGRVVKVPPSVIATLGKVDKARSRMEQRAGWSPGLEEVARELRLTEESVENALGIMNGTVRLRGELDDDGEGVTEGFLVDPAAVADEDADQALTRRYLLTLLGALDSEERKVIREFYGLDTGEQRSLEHVARGMGCTREWIRQVRNKALRKLQRRDYAIGCAKRREREAAVKA